MPFLTQIRSTQICTRRVRRDRLLGFLGLLLAPLIADAGPWIKVTAPHFTLYSNTSGGTALKSANDLQVFITALALIIPVDEAALPPLTIILFQKKKEFLPFRPLAPNGKPRDVAGYFCRMPNWAVFALNAETLNAESRRTIYHEAVHWFRSANEGPRPMWLEEGLAEVFSTFVVTPKKEVLWGEQIPAHARLLAMERALPLRSLLAVTHTDPLFNEDLRTGVFYAGSWAFVHYLLFSKDASERPLLTEFLNAIQSGKSTDELFQAAFQTDHEGMDKRLHHYTHTGQYVVRRAPRPAETSALTAAPASAFEVQVAEARLAVGSKQVDLATRHAQAAAQLDPESPVPHELLGYAADAANQPDAMVAAFEEAARRKSRDHHVHFTLGNQIVRAGTSLSLWVRLSPQEARRAVDHFEMSVNCRRNHLPSFQNIARLMNLCERSGPADRAFLELGRQQYPTDGEILIGLATLDWKDGAFAKARQDLERLLLAPAPPEPVVRNATHLLAQWSRQDRLTALQRQVEAGKLPEALTAMDAALAGDLDRDERAQLILLRRNVAADLLQTRITTALRSNQLPEAHVLIARLLDSDAPESAKRSARALLDKIKTPVPPRE